MKNFVKWIGIIALVAVIGFSMTACNGKGNDGNGNNSGNGDNGGQQGGGGGGLTINGLPSSTVFDVFVYDYSGRVTNRQEYLAFATAFVNEDDDVIAGKFKSSSPFALEWMPGANSSGTYLISVEDSNKDYDARFFSQVRFTNGSATVNYNSASYIAASFID